MGGEQVGEHLGVEAGGDRLVTHLFECLDPAYPGWRWAVTVTRAARAKTVTVDDSALLPGPDALLAPAWVPWRDRLQPGDVGVGDLLPAHDDDERLVPMVMLAGDDAVVDWYADGPPEAPDPPGAREAPQPAFPGRGRVLSPPAVMRPPTGGTTASTARARRWPVRHPRPAPAAVFSYRSAGCSARCSAAARTPTLRTTAGSCPATTDAVRIQNRHSTMHPPAPSHR